MTPLRILIADDHAVVRAGLKALLEQQPDFQVVAEAESGLDAVRQAVAHQPDIVVMDIRMPGGLSGIEACEQIVSEMPGVKVIMLTSYAEDELVMDAVRVCMGSSFALLCRTPAFLLIAVSFARRMRLGRTGVGTSGVSGAPE